jgi:hypothetical protein
MLVKIAIKDVSYSTDSRRVEAYRRAVEIREFSRERNSNSAVEQKERFRWITPLKAGRAQVEEVLFDHQAGVITYSCSENRAPV